MEPTRNPLILFTLDGTEHVVDLNARTALDLHLLRPFITDEQLIKELLDGPTVMAAGALLYLARRRTDTPLTVEAAYDSVTAVSVFAVALADATTPPAPAAPGVPVPGRDELADLVAAGEVPTTVAAVKAWVDADPKLRSQRALAALVVERSKPAVKQRQALMRHLWPLAVEAATGGA